MLSILNNFAHGYVAVPVALACRRAGLFDVLQREQYMPWAELVAACAANSGHLRVAARLLESIGWIERGVEDAYRLGADAHKCALLPEDVAHLLDFSFSAELAAATPGSGLQTWLQRSAGNWGLTDTQLINFLDGMIVLPLFLTLCQRQAAAVPANQGQTLFSHLSAATAALLQEYFCAKGWGRITNGVFSLSETGEFLRERILNTGVVASYRPMLQKVQQVIFGDCVPIFARDAEGHETHIDRTLNVIGSGFQHQRYFSDMEEVILSIFDNERFDEQPRYIADMGCGDGAFLKSIYAVVLRSRRGQVLASHPLQLIGVDINQKSLDQTSLTLRGIAHQTIVGDIGDPQRLVDDLRKIGIHDPENILHVRTFLDHDRPFIAPRRAPELPAGREEVFVAPDGSEIDPDIACQSLVEHLERWSSIVSKYGLLVLEVHSLPAQTVRAHMHSENLHFDAVQAFSGQLMTSAEQFLMAAAGGGLFAHQDFVRNYPKTLPYTRITLNFLQRRDYRLRFARDTDLDALDQLEDLCWDAKLRAPRAVLAQRIARYPVGQLVVEQNGQVVGVIYSQRLASADDVSRLPASQSLDLHTPGGPVVQLVAVNVHPDLQDRKLGDQLLEFMLQRCALLSGITAVVGVTRCKDFAAHPEVKLEDYVRMRNAHGRLLDPVLRFHELHGANIGRLVPGYRPADSANQGYGVVVEYDIHRRQRKDGMSPSQAAAVQESASQTKIDRAALEQTVAAVIKSLLGPARATGFDSSAPLMEMGLDSADLLELSEVISQQMQVQLAPTFFFEHNTSDKVAAELRRRSAATQAAPLKSASPASPALSPVQEAAQAIPAAQAALPVAANDVAIIGIACRLPGGITQAEELWDVLLQGESAYSTLPSGRWSWPASIQPGTTHAGIDRGAFLDDISGFDAALFRISPREAGLMDPQQRILLELSWTCIEDAGYAANTLAGSRTGVYIGASGSDYQLLLNEAGGEVEAHYGLATSMAVLPNRISYFYDFNGPSVQLDTACSSALVALHAAMQTLRNGSCQQALVGAINLMCHPANTLAYYRAGMLAKDGRCKTFDARADGYVRGEGALMLMLKPLTQALAEGDNVYAVIKGGAVNHGGQAGGLTVPHPGRQAELLLAACADAGVAMGDLSYLEAHGTGTALGDPIEVSGIKRALTSAAQEQAVRTDCGLGSVKTVLGHLEAAAGLAGLLKVVLCMRHQTLPATLHFQELNPKIDLSETRCYVVDKTRPWLPESGLPRYAGVSSFGSGGTNAHVILQEFPLPQTGAGAVPGAPVLVPLSARSEAQLMRLVQRLLQLLQGGPQDLSALAYTLQTGRVAQPVRLALIAADQASLMLQLRALLDGAGSTGAVTAIAGSYRSAAGSAALDQDDLQQLLPLWLAKHKLDKLADAWVRGAALAWDGLYAAGKPRRISLPTYPFAHEKHWLESAPHSAEQAVQSAQSTQSAPAAALHPLLHVNRSNLYELRYSTQLRADEYYLQDHQVGGQRVLPAVAQLEMARAALQQACAAAGDSPAIELSGVVFLRPVLVESGLELHIALEAQADGSLDFEIFSESGAEDEVLIHSKGQARLLQKNAPALDLSQLQSRCTRRLEVNAFYAACRGMGLEYGPAMRAIHQLQALEDGPQSMVLAGLTLPDAAQAGVAQWVLNPSLLDGSLQAGFALSPQPAQTMLPFAIERVQIYRTMPQQAVAVVRHAEPNAGGTAQIRKLNVTVCDMQGQVCVELEGYSCRAAEIEAGRQAELLLFSPEWVDEAAHSRDTAGFAQRWVLLATAQEAQSEIESMLPEVRCRTLGGGGDSEPQQAYAAAAAQLLKLLQEILQARPQGRVLLQLVVADAVEAMAAQGLYAMLRCAMQENSKLHAQVLQIAAAERHLLAARLQAQIGSSAYVARYVGDKRQVHAWREMNQGQTWSKPWRDGGVYLITGGSGGLGLIFAREIAHQVKNPTLVLTARSALKPAQREQLLALVAMGARVEFKQVDVSDAAQVQELIAAIVRECGALHGILHSAGVLRDAFIINQNSTALEQVLAPKVSGLYHLDHASRTCALDCFLIFSSVTAALGNAGQVDYAAANAFMDSYAAYRRQQVAAGYAQGRTLVINWPLWADGGMQVDAAARKMFQHNFGMQAMSSAHGIEALYRAWASTAGQVLVMAGNADKIRLAISGAVRQTGEVTEPAEPATALLAPAAEVVVSGAGLQQAAEQYLIRLLSATLKMPPHRIEAEAALEAYGIDSVLVMELTRGLEQVFGTLPKTLFFEYQNMRALAAYLLQKYPARWQTLLGTGGALDSAPAVSAQPAPVPVPASATRQRRRFAAQSAVLPAPAAHTSPALDIAIIGLSGRYPQARNLQEYWQNLTQGKNCISEVPAARWAHAAYFDAEKGKPGKSYSKWGGFIEGVDQFDPLFFNISPREAVGMDPQERLFLQCVHATLEDAGYSREELRRHLRPEQDGNVGVFVGVMYQEYQLYGAQSQVHGDGYALLGSTASIANRISYYFNFHGPSIALDTMCSSSLTAIHLACQSLVRGTCEMAVAGGVNISVHPNKYLMLAQGRFVSSDGLCRSFGVDGDGYVPGEGVGAVLLKPLHQAVADGDHIYGVIKASAINHGGKTNGYTVPNPQAQAQVIAQALKEADIPARAISYIEAHGTGTSLGDPIEIAGLSKAFAAHTQDLQFCAIGSAKSNIGHCESAAGIAGLSKVLLQMQHGQLVPSLHSASLNPNIDFSQTPFVVQQELQPWARPVLEENGHRREYPRIAGLSSFGAGGANAHLIVQEYQPLTTPQAAGGPVLLVLSARNTERLQVQAEQLLQALGTEALQGANLRDLAYTLQVGREAMECRLACVVDSMDAVRSRLQALVAGAVEDWWQGDTRQAKDALALFSQDDELQEAVAKWVQRGKLDKLAQLWSRGYAFDWHSLYQGQQPAQTPQRLSLPTYPFAEERHWLPEMPRLHMSAARGTFLHPLLHSNTSSLHQQRYSSSLSGAEYYLADHQVQGKRILPAAAQLEMARAALHDGMELAAQGGALALREIVFVRPLEVEQARLCHVLLQAEEDGSVAYEIYSEQDGEEVVHSQGRAVLQAESQAPQLNLAQWQQAGRQTLSAEECYAQFQGLGLEYGPAMRALQTLHKGEDAQGHAFVLAHLALPPEAQADAEHMRLNPSLLDAALQASIALLAVEGKAVLPFALEELHSYAALPTQAYALLRENPGSSTQVRKLDIQICDAQGLVCAALSGFSTRVVDIAARAETLLFRPQWEALPSLADADNGADAADAANTAEDAADAATQRWVLLATAQQMRAELEAVLPGVQFLSLGGHSQNRDQSSAQDYAQAAAQLLEFLRNLMRSQPHGLLRLQLVAAAGGNAALLQGLAGMLNSAALENNRLQVQLLVLEGGQEAQLAQFLQTPVGGHIRYLNGAYQQRRWQEIGPDATVGHSSPWKDGGVYLITGGSGGLGLIFAEEIAAQVKQPTLVLSARSALSDAQHSRLSAMQVRGARVEFKQVDVCDQQQVRDLIAGIEREHGALNGILHSAGVLRDGFLFKKSAEDLSQVLAPKVQGLLNLDLASRHLKLDCFILFSSTSAVLGNLGQSDYAAANAFMDAYAAQRNVWRANGLRQGHTLSLNWPLWAEGGMQVDAATRRHLWQSLGMRAMARADGVAALYRAWSTGADQVLVVDGDAQALRASLRTPAVAAPVIQVAPATPALLGDAKDANPAQAKPPLEDDLALRTEAYLKQLLARGLKLSPQRIEADIGLEAYGIDSVMVMELTRELEQVFGSLSKTLFFEYQSIRALSAYLLQGHRARLQSLLGRAEAAAVAPPALPVAAPTAQGTRRLKRQAVAAASTQIPAANGALDIAIIGLNGRYPQANTLQDYWQNLIQGKNCISEVPAERWTHAAYFDAEKGKPGKSYSKWGGFIDGVDQFDSLFFNITPREAAGMDPQERLFLQCVHATLEDAGYNREELRRSQSTELEGNVGVFVGVMYEEYQLYGAQAQVLGEGYAVPGTTASIANRVSYYFNFHGPSIALDTMCSSSLTAIHLACQSLARGSCELALAGGVNVSVHPNKYLVLSQGRFASSDGLCRSFGADGDGYVPGEGVGAVLLKPLHKAVADGDHIYGVIKASAINHGGKTNGYTVPNPQAQAQVIAQALKESGVPARAISYIEAHGTGTSLGDPIEITGLSKAFAAHTQDKQFCAIGSAKSNIGHCESAAGIAGLSKVLLQMQHGQLVPSLHATTLNPHIDFSQTPFVVQQELQPWARPVLEENGRRREYPRTAGLSSFGAGGANAHLIVQEYLPSATPQVETGPVVLVLSARDKERLQVQAQQLLQALGTEALQVANLRDLAYTLQVGREAMECRLACVVDSMDAVRNRLQAFLTGEVAGWWQADIRHSKDALALFGNDEALHAVVQQWLQQGKLDKLAQLWSRGYTFAWRDLYQGQQALQTPQRLSLPTYPFAKERHWVPALQTPQTGQIAPNPAAAAVLHPLLHANISNFHEQAYSTLLHGDEYYLRDHRLRGQAILPAVAQLEMARAAMLCALNKPLSQGGLMLSDVMLARPVLVNSACELHISLEIADDEVASFEIFSIQAEESQLHSQGRAWLSTQAAPAPLALPELLAACTRELSPQACYAQLQQMGLEYGPAMRALHSLRLGQDAEGTPFLLAALHLPAAAHKDAAHFVLNPSLLDAALQASIALIGAPGAGQAVLPLAFSRVAVWRALPQQAYAVLRPHTENTAQLQKFDIVLCTAEGEVCVELLGFSSRAAKLDSTEQSATLLFQRAWAGRALQACREQPPAQQVVLVCARPELDLSALQAALPGVRCVQSPVQGGLEQVFAASARLLMTEVQTLLRSGLQAPALVQVVVPVFGETQALQGLAGLLKSAQLENPRLQGQLLALEECAPQQLADLLKAEANSLDERVFYEDGQRLLDVWNEVEENVASQPWQDGGVYLISGGSGGLGLIFAEEIAAQVKQPTLVLTARSALNDAQRSRLRAMQAGGARIEFKQVDVCDLHQVTELIAAIESECGPLNGIIHSAGVLRDGFLLMKSAEDLSQVLAPKVQGLLNLDLASRHCKLDCFLLFSSTSAAFGNSGQSDYAAANGFMDAYAAYRNLLSAEGQRHGRTLSLNWPLWADGGMQVDEVTRRQLWQNLGMRPMARADGVNALYRAWATGADQVLVVDGDVQRLRRVCAAPQPTASVRPALPMHPAQSATTAGSSQMEEKALAYFRKLLAAAMKLPLQRLDVDARMDDYGIDSVMVMELTAELEKPFGALSKTLFFEYQSVRALTGYFLQAHRAQLESLLGTHSAATTQAVPAPQPAIQSANPRLSVRRMRAQAAPSAQAQMTEHVQTSVQDIAVIGMSGRYAAAQNLAQMWRNLAEGRNCISEVPAERWDQNAYFDPQRGKAGKSYTKWAGFLDGVDEFDPLFFNISPREAEYMDPQERLFLQEAYAGIEDAGYTPATLSAGQKVAVFVGVMNGRYPSGAQYWSIANRVSYLLNFQGPSMAVDSACSSSLTALHLAMESLRNGSADCALAGGVNLIVDPQHLVVLSGATMLSAGDQCRSFGAQADGFVDGEGVGVVVLKPLQQAEADGDHIYGVLKGSMVNAGGRTNGYTVPNPNAQAQLVTDALTRARINPRTVSYIEAHGTGTALGDPIEIAGLSKAFAVHTQDKQFCAIGSAKSNIGHCESAAGIAGLSKVLLQMQHGQIAPSLHSANLNPNIDFAQTPFVVQQTLAPWVRPVIQEAGQSREYPRIAGLSSFGAGGANAHVVVQEYVMPPRKEQFNGPALVVLSARTVDALQQRVSRLLQALQEDAAIDLHDLAYTLQCGREAMEERLALLVTDHAALEQKLAAYLAGETEQDDVWRGQVKRNRDMMASFMADEDMLRALDAWLEKGKYDKLLEMWVKGLSFDWQRLYPAARPRRISLPSYPFAKESYWLKKQQGQQGQQGQGQEQGQVASSPAVAVQAAATQTAPEPLEVMTFEESWQLAPLAAATEVAAQRKRENGVLLCFLSDAALQQAFATAVAVHQPECKLVFVAHQSTTPTAPGLDVRVLARSERAAYLDLLQQLQQQGTAPQAILYLWGVEAAGGMADQQAIVYLLQALAAVPAAPQRLILAAQANGSAQDAEFASWIGYERSAGLILPGVAVNVLTCAETAPFAARIEQWAGIVCDELAHAPQRSVLYQDGRRYRAVVERTHLEQGPSVLRRNGVYLISGGLGGLGYLFARYLRTEYEARLVLCGRSALDAQRQALLEALDASGTEVMYIAADVCNVMQMDAVLDQAKARFGGIDGVIHAAGSVDAGHLLQKEWPDCERVLAAKIGGTQTLAHVLRHEKLDFICYFSSAAAILGDFGSCDYAVGNRYQMAFAARPSYPQRQVVINWPLWAEGGMGPQGTEQTELYLASSGQQALTATQGFALFEQILAQAGNQHLVLVTQASRAARLLRAASGEAASAPAPAPYISQELQQNQQSNQQPGQQSSQQKRLPLAERFKADLAALAAGLLKLPPERLDHEASLSDFGFDSISLGQLARELVTRFQVGVTPATFFVHSTLEQLWRHCLQEYAANIEAYYAAAVSAPAQAVPELVAEQVQATAAQPSPTAVPQKQQPAQHGQQDIAIIGISGRFPQARDVDGLWEILRQGQDAVGPAPQERPGTWQTTGARCGFVPGVAEFDPLFFGISPMEAKLMDPRQRLLLQEAWNALEDAGYGSQHTKGRSIGMFVGVEEGDFHLLQTEGGTITSNHNGILAARLAYLLDCHGPTMAINAACASGLVALHQACRSLQAGECETAVAASVSLMLTPAAHGLMREAGMLSPDQQCRAFAADASGMTPAEAVVAVVLKPLAQAVADGDPIHAVIEASGINSDGKTNGITAPNGAAQAALLKAVYQRHQIDPARIGYVIAHGTGTPLGDPVELNALQEVFAGVAPASCALTSTKSNFGHALAASGMLSLVAMVQALRHKMIPPSLHCKQENPYFAWNKGAFYVNQSLRAWDSPAGAPRRGALSAFGMSGTNSHLVLREAPATAPSAGKAGAHLLLLSARNEDALRAKVQALHAALGKPDPARDVAALSHTLLAGRQHFRQRLALVADDLNAVRADLQSILNGDMPQGVFSGRMAEQAPAAAEAAGRIAQLRQQVQQAQHGVERHAALAALAQLYCEGHTIGWYEETRPPRLHLPGYPFARENYWPAQAAAELALELAEAAAGAAATVTTTLANAAPETPAEQYRKLLQAVKSGRVSVQEAALSMRRQSTQVPTADSHGAG